MSATINVHFVCQGNSYRSRLAEAYAKSLRLPGFSFTSSGITATTSPHKNISSDTTRLLRQHNLSHYASTAKQQTTSELLGKQDMIVFLSKDVFDRTALQVSFDSRKAVQWHIDDVWQQALRSGESPSDALAVRRLTTDTFQRIVRQTQVLAKELIGNTWVNVYNEHNVPLGFRLPLNRLDQPGLWHRGVHAVIVTGDRKILVQKRSTTIMYAPNLLDVSLGGFVDNGETPRQAVLREIEEEIGIKVADSQLRPLSIHKQASYHRKRRHSDRVFIYNYAVKIPSSHAALTLQASEVQTVRFLSYRQVRQLLLRHRLRGFGALNYAYGYYADILKRVKLEQ